MKSHCYCPIKTVTICHWSEKVSDNYKVNSDSQHGTCCQTEIIKLCESKVNEPLKFDWN